MASTKLLAPALGLAFAASFCAPACADRIAHPTAVFSGLDKITGRIISFEVAANETVQFGSLQITEKACYTRPATEAPQTTTFTQVDEIDAKKPDEAPRRQPPARSFFPDAANNPDQGFY